MKLNYNAGRMEDTMQVTDENGTRSVRSYLMDVSRKTGLSFSCLRTRWDKGKRGSELRDPKSQRIFDVESRRKWCGKTFRGWSHYLQMYGVAEASFQSVRNYYYDRRKDTDDKTILRNLFDYYQAAHPELTIIYPSILTS